MMQTKTLTYTLTLAITIAPVVASFDRAAEHELQMSGYRGAENSFESKERFGQPAALSIDYILSNSPAPAHFTQDYADLAQLNSGDWVAVWSDNRLGANKIFIQLLTGTGSLLDTNILMATSPDGGNLSDPIVLADTLGAFYLVYRNSTSGLILGRRFSDALAPVGVEFQINSTAAGAYAGPFDAAIYPDGRLVVVWENYSVSGSTIELRTYDASGVSTLGPVTVNSDLSASNRWTPSVVADPQSGFLVAWEDYRFGNADIYARLFTGAGTAVGPDFGLVPPGAADSQQYTPEVAFSSRDQYAIGWIDSRAGQEVYLQAYDATSGLVGANTIISVANPSAINWNLEFAVDSVGDLLATWDATVPQSSILTRAFTTGFAPAGLPEQVNTSSTGQRWNPTAAFSRIGSYAVCWSEFQNNHSDIAFQLFNSTGASQLAELTVNDDSRGSPKSDPVILASSDGFNLAAFVSKGVDQGDIILSSISNFGSIQIPNTTVNQDGSDALQSEPSLGASSTQGFVIWNDGRDVLGVPGQRIYGRFCGLYGVFSTNEFMISDSAQVGLKSSPFVAMAPSGKALTAWIDLRGGSPQVWGRWITSGGALDGVEIQISQAGTDSSCTDVSAGTDLNGRFYITWVDRRFTPIVRGHWYNADGSDGGYITYAPAGAPIDELSAAINDSGEVTVVYTGNLSGQKLFVAAVNRSSTEILSPSQIDDNIASNPSEPEMSFSESTDQFAVAWVDRRAGLRSIEYQILDANRLPVGANQAVSSAVPEYMINPSVTLNDGRAWFAWADPRQYGQNIWSTVSIYEPTGTDDKPVSVPSSFVMQQNYPNPFNPSTEIRFSMATRGEAKLEVFNILGERIAVLADGTFSSGEHRVTWNGVSQSGGSVASGIYLYRLTAADGAFTRKMALVK